jgi:hypothetical protein
MKQDAVHIYRKKTRKKLFYMLQVSVCPTQSLKTATDGECFENRQFVQETPILFASLDSKKVRVKDKVVFFTGNATDRTTGAEPICVC